MKKFVFPLNRVLNYKYQVLDELKREHGVIISAIVEKEAEIRIIEGNYNQQKDEFNFKKEQGISILEALSYESHLHIMQHNIKKEYEKLDKLHVEEKAKRKEVVEVKTETSSFEKLKEKRIEEYNQEVQKSEERFIEEFVANKSVSLRMQA